MKDSVCFGCASHKGIIRDENQDSVYVGRNKFNQTFGVVCDGLGGYKGGKIASSIVMEMFKYAFLINDFSKMNEKQVKAWFGNILRLSKSEISKTILNHEINENDYSLQRMATTIVAVLIIGEKIYTFWVGDSRAYLIDANKEAWQITKDHNLYNYFLDNNTSQKIIDDNKDNLLALTNIVSSDTNAEKNRSQFDMDEFSMNVNQINDNTYILICSDGFYNFVDSKEFYNLITENAAKKQDNLILVSGELLKIGMERLSNDNLTVVLINLKNIQ